MTPLLAVCLLVTAGLSSAAPAQEPDRATTFDTGESLRIVVFGDQMPGAADAPEDPRCRPDTLRADLASLGIDADVLDVRRDGLDLAAHAARLRRDVQSAEPHVVVLQFGHGADGGGLSAEALFEFFKTVVFELHVQETHVVFLSPGVGARAARRGQLAVGQGYDMAATWFGEPLVAPADDSFQPSVAQAIGTLHKNRGLPTRPAREPELPRMPPHDLVESGLLHEIPSTGLKLSGLAPASGDFRLAADVVLEAFDHSAASFQFDGGHLGFDGSDARLFTEGPAFGGGPFFHLNPITPGKPFRLVVERAGEDLRFRIDGRLVAATRWAQPVELLGFRPHRGKLEVRGAWISGAALVPADLPLAPGYTIPLLDLAGDTDRQVVVDREEGQYLGHPTTFLHEDGSTMLVVYPKGHGKGAIVYKRSEDGGRTWSERLPVPESWASSQEVPTLFRTEDADGVKRLILFSGLAPIRMAVSEDDGASWSELEPIGDYGGIVAMASCAQAGAPGRYLAWFHDDGRFIGDADRPSWGGAFHLYQVESLDGGMSWGAPRSIVSHRLAHLCEPGVVKSPDGGRLALLLRENKRIYNSFVVFSDDAGATWSRPRQLPAALTGDRHTAKYAPDGRLVVTFRDTTRDSPTQGDWVAWVGTWQDVVDGGEGQYRVRLMDNKHRWDCAYPGLELLPDGTFVTTTYGHWTEGEPPWIACVRFTLEELDALAAAQNQ